MTKIAGGNKLPDAAARYRRSIWDASCPGAAVDADIDLSPVIIRRSAHEQCAITWPEWWLAFAGPVPAPSPYRVALHRAGANRLGPLPAFSAAEVLMHANDSEDSVEPIGVDLALAAAATMH